MRILNHSVRKVLEGRPIQGFLFLFFLFGTLLTSGSEGRTEVEPSLVIVPFLVQRVEDPEKGVLCPVCKGIRRSGEILAGSEKTMTHLLYKKMETDGTFRVIPAMRVEEIILPLERKSIKERPVLESIQIGKALNADFVL
ncbi:MAG: hypothetical protein ACUVWO_11375, partial [Thermodesulfobacteriota bacterium]